MKSIFTLFFAVCLCYTAIAQIDQLDFAKSGNVEKTNEVGVRKERKDKYGYNSQIERSFLKAGYIVANDYKSFYVVEYYVGAQPNKGKDDYTFRMKMYESTSGKLVATASVISSRRNDILDRLQMYIDEFINRLNN